MALPTYSKSVGTVFTIAARTHLKTIATDNFFTKCPLYEELRKNKMSKVSGGQTLVVPVINGASPLGGAYSKAATIPMQDSEVLTEAQYPWSFYQEPVVIYHQDLWMGRGEEAILDLVKVKTEVAMKKLKRSIFTALYAASPVAGLDLLGLPAAIATTPASSGSYGNLDGSASAQSWWRNYSASGGSFASGGVDALVAMFRTLADQSDAGKPTAAFTDPTTWGYIHKEVIGHFETHAMVDSRAQQYCDLGFQAISFMGTPIVSDPFCTSGVIYAINSEAAQLIEMKDAAFQLHPDGFVSDLPNRQMAWVSSILWNGQLATFERRALGKIYSITS